MDMPFPHATATLPQNPELLKRLAISIIIALRLFARIAKHTGEQRISDIHLVGILIIARLWIDEFRHRLTMLGIMSVGLAIAHKEAVMNITGGLCILWRGVFRAGGRIIQLPNSLVITLAFDLDLRTRAAERPL